MDFYMDEVSISFLIVDQCDEGHDIFLDCHGVVTHQIKFALLSHMREELQTITIVWLLFKSGLWR